MEGISVFGAGAGRPLNTNAVLARKHEIKQQAEKMIKAAIAAGRDLEGAELKQYNMHLEELKTLDDTLHNHYANSAMAHSIEHQRTSTGSNRLQEMYNRASSEVRTRIDAFVSEVRGIRASADLRPSVDGGLLIPSDVQRVFEHDYAAFAPVLGVARIYTTPTGEKTVYPVMSDSESAVQLDAAAATGADATVSGDAPPTALTGPTLAAWKVSSKPIFINREILTDSPLSLLQEVIGAQFARITRFENLKYTKGNGTTEAEGFITNATAYHAGAVALDLDIALDVAYSVPPLYRPNGAYMASDTTIKYLRKLKTGISGDKRSLWKDAFEEGNATLGTPAKLHGYPIYVNNDMDSVAADGTFASVSPLAFGDFTKFVIRQAENGGAYVRVYEVPAKDGRASIVFRRSDSALLVPTAISKLVV
jgi:HK97 family phage major capsid protein